MLLLRVNFSCDLTINFRNIDLSMLRYDLTQLGEIASTLTLQRCNHIGNIKGEHNEAI